MFDTATLTVGRDGKVYIASNGSPGTILRLNRDGSERRIHPAYPDTRNITANSIGMMASANAGAAHMLTLFDPDFYCLWAMGKIYGGTEEIGLSAPAHVEAGAGDFYAPDAYRDQIVRCAAFGKRTAIYHIPREDAAGGEIVDFRVCEQKSLLYVLTADAVLRCFDISGKEWNVRPAKRWAMQSDLVASTREKPNGRGGFDVDDAGILYLHDGTRPTLQRFAPDGRPMDPIALQIPEHLRPAADAPAFTGLRIFDGEALLKRPHPTELFQRYDLSTGALKSVADLNDAPDPTPPPIRVLFIGNSQIASCGWSIPAMIEELSHSEPPGVARIEADEVVLFGSSLKDRWEQAEGLHKILNGKWDWVVLHESVLQLDRQQTYEYMRRFHAHAAHGNRKMIILATGDLENQRPRHAITYEDALKMSHELKCSVAGGGMAWLKVWEKDPAHNLHHTDRAHPNAAGAYLNACVLYAAMTSRTPVGLAPYVLPKDQAAFLQTIAWQQAQEDRIKETP